MASSDCGPSAAADDDGGMGGMESTASFLAVLDEVAAESKQVKAKLRDMTRRLDALDDAAAQEATKGDDDDDQLLDDDLFYVPPSSHDSAAAPVDPADWIAEYILARRIKGGQLYYKVRWARQDVVSWVKDEDVDNRALVDSFERLHRLVERTPSYGRRGVRPQQYVNSKRAARRNEQMAEVRRQYHRFVCIKLPTLPIEERAPAARTAAPTSGAVAGAPVAASAPAVPVASTFVPLFDAGVSTQVRRALRRDEEAQWLCEVEPSIWIPYEPFLQERLERDYRANRCRTQITVETRQYTIDLDNLVQQGGANRRMQRVVRRTVEAEREYVNSLSLEELRQYISQLPDLNEAHFEVLSRLHEEDQVVKGTSAEELRVVERTTFADVMDRVLRGVEFPGFTSECLMCLEDYVGTDELALLPVCAHFFHATCADDYFRRYKGLCPVCKQPIAGTQH